MNRRLAALALTASLVVSLVVAAPVGAAGPTIPLPATMAAVGDSITQAASSAGSLGGDAPQNSWSTGTSASVNSHYLRLVARGASGLARHNLSVSGAKVADLPGQTLAAAALQPDYLTVLIGGNDVCTSTAAGMTAPAQFEAHFRTALANVDTARTHVYVVSIPRVMGLWELFRNNFLARFIWSVAGICQSLLANPGSTAQADVDRRAQVDARNRAFNEILARVCSETPNCHHDGGAAFNTTFTTSDVSGDYFHPSVSGQAKLADVSWIAGYVWQQPNQAPVASFTSSCTDLACTFDDTSTDADGAIASRSWSFGGGGDPQTHTFPAAGTYPVSLTVTDDDGASATANASVTVSAAPAPTMRVGDLLATRVKETKTTWSATVTILVTTPSGAPVSGATVSGSWSVGAPDTCITDALGTCAATSDTFSRSATRSVTFQVAELQHATHDYAPALNVESSITVTRP